MTTEPMTTPARSVPAPDLLGNRRFKAMNTQIDLYARDIDDTRLFAQAEDLFHAMEDRLSRFRPASELCLLNNRAGSETPVSRVLFDILRCAKELHQITGGVFEPAILGDLEAAGYDRSFEEVERSNERMPAASTSQLVSIKQLRLNQERRSACAPEGLRIDLGGIGKGFTVDAAAKLLAPVRDFVVNAGGDIFASGAGPDGNGWLVNITDPNGVLPGVSLVRLHDEALATSTTALRRWTRGETTLHHLIDPRTRRPAQSGVLSVSVVAPTATEADVFAKTALVLGLEEGARFLENNAASGLFVMEDGALISTPGWRGKQAA